MALTDEHYWLLRTSKAEKQADIIDSELLVKVQQIARGQARELAIVIDTFYSNYAKENGISRQEAEKRIRAIDLSNYVDKANDFRESPNISEQALRRLDGQYLRARMTRLELLYAELEQIGYRAAEKEARSYTEYFARVSKETTKIIAENTLLSSIINKDALEAILRNKWSGANYSDRIWRNKDRMVQALQDELTKGVIRGDNPKKIARSFRKIISSSISDSERLIRTESTNIMNESIRNRYQDAGFTKYQFVAKIDERTSTICKHLNDEEFDFVDYQQGSNAPPMHPRCRSRIVPVDSELNRFDKYLG
ncbi:minor capsid protein [Listeria booriae]|uniref:Minor capsid protein n=1 Tax=Listeria booriae TaxID=1552123 RepID=A0A7X0YJM4_9LIST|nr:minor capsid protein [Listeria booriae]MBC1290623.1 minor capsid protein [Listeria booriae]MBC2115693.1 minor capsid protein [Listeria booriae]MBC2163426.1 minor capsid protein [Listeria booriae]